MSIENLVLFFIACGAATFPLGVWLILQPPLPVVAVSILAAAFIIYRHSSNVERLRMGTERS